METGAEAQGSMSGDLGGVDSSDGDTVAEDGGLELPAEVVVGGKSEGSEERRLQMTVALGGVGVGKESVGARSRRCEAEDNLLGGVVGGGGDFELALEQLNRLESDAHSDERGISANVESNKSASSNVEMDSEISISRSGSTFWEYAGSDTSS